ncbi:MAG: oligopeptide/dipeptide ABC transporter ATP-binding protein [Holophaga sp.]|jgi:oligopeptide transport system ATP-binding protein
MIEVTDLQKHFTLRRGLLGRRSAVLKAVDGVSFTIREGRTFGLVGESGCGKTTVGRTLIKLYEPTGGTIRFGGQDITHLDAAGMFPFRKQMQMIFQDPYSSLDPRMTVAEIIGEPLDVHRICRGQDRLDRIRELIARVGLKREHLGRYPHEFSGGQRQRIGIARALAVEPRFIVCDEAISALDVSIQAQIINMLEDLQEKFGLTYLFVSHDLSVVKHISHEVGVMYLGSLVECAERDELFRNMQHPYTQSLISASPVADPDAAVARRRIILQGDVPSPVNPPSGCAFRTRCPLAKPICAQERPRIREISPSHRVACHLIGDAP